MDLDSKIRKNNIQTRREIIASPTGEKTNKQRNKQTTTKPLYHELVKKKNLHPHYKIDEPHDSDTGPWQKTEVQR